jgi:multimeric flavodoxin WrbA
VKILLISSSPKGENSLTFRLALETLKGAEAAGAETETIHLRGCRIEFCSACDACHKNGMRCQIEDDAGRILGKFLEAVGIILASPNYLNQVTASMKALFDRSSHLIHCKRLTGKYTAGVSSSGSGRNKEALDYIAYYSNMAGAQCSGRVSSGRLPDQEKKKEAFKLGMAVVSDIKSGNKYPEQIEKIEAARIAFASVIKLRRNDWPAEYTYWQEKVWL